MPTPLDTLSSIDHHPLPAAAWRHQRPADEIAAERGEATRLEAQWAELQVARPGGAESDEQVIERLTLMAALVAKAAVRHPSLSGWYRGEYAALAQHAARLLGAERGRRMFPALETPL